MKKGLLGLGLFIVFVLVGLTISNKVETNQNDLINNYSIELQELKDEAYKLNEQLDSIRTIIYSKIEE